MTRLADCYRLLKRRLYVSGKTERAIVDDFHRLYHQVGRIKGGHITWRGRPVAQNPMDLLAIAGIIYKSSLDWKTVIEVGTGEGGSAKFWHAAGADYVYTIDRFPPKKAFAPGVEFVHGDSMRNAPGAYNVAVVILDGDHHYQTVYDELCFYAPRVIIGGYLIVCDTHFNGHPIAPEFGPGPWEAVEAFLAERDDFVRDYDVQPLFTFNPGGYLRRVK